MPTVRSSFATSKEIEFDAGHRVPDHEGKCSSPHGHRYRVMLAVGGELQVQGSAKGMILDFSDIKKVLQEIHDKFDHGFIISKNDETMIDAIHLWPGSWKVIVVDFSPTAEELARWCYEYADSRFEELGLAGTVLGARVWETPTSSALYGLE